MQLSFPFATHLIFWFDSLRYSKCRFRASGRFRIDRWICPRWSYTQHHFRALFRSWNFHRRSSGQATSSCPFRSSDYYGSLPRRFFLSPRSSIFPFLWTCHQRNHLRTRFHPSCIFLCRSSFPWWSRQCTHCLQHPKFLFLFLLVGHWPSLRRRECRSICHRKHLCHELCHSPNRPDTHLHWHSPYDPFH